MAEEEEAIVSKSQELGEDDNVANDNDDGLVSDFVMQEEPSVDVDNLFGAAEEEKEEEFREGEEAGLYIIPEEGEEEESPEIATEYRLMEEEIEGEYVLGEEAIVMEDDAEAAKDVAEYMEEEHAVAARIERDKMMGDKDKEESSRKRTMSADSLKVKGVGVQNRYELISQTLSGDFIQHPDDLFVRETHGASYTSLVGIEEVEEEEKTDVEEEIEGTLEEEYVDREPYIELYKSLMKEYPMLKMKNNFLQRKMAEYFKRRKMEHVLRESDRVGDSQAKYYKKLDALWELRNTNNMQRSAITAELNEMKELRDRQVKSVVDNFEAMQTREREIGKGLIFTKTAKEIPEKFLERLLKNQRTKSHEIMEMRLCFIKLRNNIDEITAAIKAMDKIGENHTLIDYEQLKMENQNHADKIEERDEELQKLRTKCAAAIQTLAHLREKSSSTDIDILEMHDKLDEVEMNRNDWRERVNELKKERDTLRANIVRLQEESGLLTKPKLLLDMEETLEQIEMCKAELQNISATYNEKAIALEAIKKNIQEEKDYYQPAKVRSMMFPKPKVCKGKPKLVYPGLEKFNIKEFQK